MTEFLTSYAGLIAVVSFITAVTAVLLAVEAHSRADSWQAWAEELEAENDRLRANARPRVVALPPRRTPDNRGGEG